jgi:hypothetical protein
MYNIQQKNGRAFFSLKASRKGNGYILILINIIKDILFKLSLSNPEIAIRLSPSLQTDAAVTFGTVIRIAGCPGCPGFENYLHTISKPGSGRNNPIIASRESEISSMAYQYTAEKKLTSAGRSPLLELEIKYKHGGFNKSYEMATVVWQQFGLGS